MPKKKAASDDAGPHLAPGEPVTAPVNVLSTQQEDAAIELRTLTLAVEGGNAMSTATAQIGTRDAEGDWREGVVLPVLRLTDTPEQQGTRYEQDEEGEHLAVPFTTPGEPAATDLIQFILSAKVDGTSALAVKHNIPDGSPLEQALPAVIYLETHPS